MNGYITSFHQLRDTTSLRLRACTPRPCIRARNLFGMRLTERHNIGNLVLPSLRYLGSLHAERRMLIAAVVPKQLPLKNTCLGRAVPSVLREMSRLIILPNLSRPALKLEPSVSSLGLVPGGINLDPRLLQLYM